MKKIPGVFGLLSFGLAALLPAAAGAQTQVNDKWITVVLPGEPPQLDGCYSGSSTQGRIIKQNVFETFIEKDPKDGSLKPRLATSWELVDPSTWRLKLRQGVIFHDGAPFNAEAAKKSLDRNWTKALACKDMVRYFGDMAIETKAVDEYTLEIKTSRPEPIVPVRLAGMAVVSPNSPLDKQALAPVGTGPYAFDSWQQGTQILLKRFDKYWGPKPQAEGARYIWRDVSSVRASMVSIGEADIALTIAEQEATDPKMDFSYLNSETTELRINAMVPPLNDRRVRLALNYAVDLNPVPGTILPKEAIRAAQIVVPAVPGHNHNLDKSLRPYDPAKAKALLAEAKADGVPVDTEITLVSYPSQFPNANELMEALLTMFQAAGFNMKIVTVEPGQYAKWSYKSPAESKIPALVQSSHDNTSGDPVFSVGFRYSCEGGVSSFCDPEFDKQILHASGLSGAERIAAWEEVFRKNYEDNIPVIPLFHMVGYTRVSPRIDFRPDMTSNAEIRIQEIKFK